MFACAFVIPMLQLVVWFWQRGRFDLDERYTGLILHTLYLGGMAALITVCVALVLAFARRQAPTPTIRAGVSLANLGYALPGSVLAVSIMLAFSYLDRENSLARIRPSLPEAARSLGVSGPRLFFNVYLPLLLPGTLSAALLVFVDVLKEMPATLLMRPFGWDTLAVRIFEMTSEGEWARASLPALTLVLVGLLPVIGLIRRSAHRIG